MQTRIEDFRALDTELIAVSVDSVEQNKLVADTYAPDVRLLSDPDLSVIDTYGLRHVDGGMDGDIARPATFVIDRAGNITWRDLTANWRIRPRPDDLLDRLR